MKLSITADWPITALDLMKAEEAIRAAYDEMLPLARLALTLPADPWEAYPGTLAVIAHATSFDGRNGSTHWFPSDGDSKIEFAWDAHQEGKHPLRHEWCHWFALQAGHPHWGQAGHGTQSDPFMVKAIESLTTLYGPNFWTEEALVAFLGYKEIDFRKPEFHNLNLQFNFRTWADGVLWCDVLKDGILQKFGVDDKREYLWHFKTEVGRLVPRSFDKMTT